MIPPIYRTSTKNFEEKLSALESRREAGQGFGPGERVEIRRRVEEIVDAVRERGDEALLEFTERFDGVKLAPERLRVSREEIEGALQTIPEDLREALHEAAGRIRRFQEAILVEDPEPIREDGRELGLTYTPVDAAGICVPGASASLASSVLMNVVPAAVAGVERVVMITPPRYDGTISADRLAAAHIAGATEIYRVFGAQAVAAVAFGTETIAPVDFIAGPGNAYVATAKKCVFGRVGIDMIAGPSEVVVVADRTARPEWVAAELLAQAEHTHGSAILVTDHEPLAANLTDLLEEQAERLPRPGEVESCLEEFGALIVADEMEQCVALTNRLAPEHLVLMIDEPDSVRREIRHAGAIFLGHCTPVAVGDYIAGPSHTLPTGTTARFSSGLTANHFRKSASLIRYSGEALAEDAGRLCTIAETEELAAHARSVRVRLEGEANSR
jgi:histidinol dehydrogenase